jgi:phosphatidylserine/phosphatidylglycerophosphate/cardiolipin synthase-like enzyme
VEDAILGSSNFTVRGLGLGSGNNIELNLIVDSNRDRQELKQWFSEVWNDQLSEGRQGGRPALSAQALR